MSIATEKKKLRDLKDTKKLLTNPAAKADVDAAIERVEVAIAKQAGKVGRLRRRKAGTTGSNAGRTLRRRG